MKKKLLALIMCVVMVIGIMPVYAFAEDGLSDWTYNVLNEEEKTAEITGYNGTETELVFPEEIDGYTMVAIADEAFCGASYYDYPITRIDVPNTYKRIGDANFRYYRNLMEVSLPHGLEYIGYRAFYRSGIFFENEHQCELRNELPVLYIGEYCVIAEESFSHDKIIYTIKPGTKLIASGAFAGMSDLFGIIIPEGVEYINHAAFADCNHIVSYVIPSTVKEIGHFALMSCDYGVYIKIPPTVTNIADDAIGGIGRKSIIYGEKDSAAETFANACGAEFIEIGDIVYGDVDSDGVVTLSDYATSKSYVVGESKFDGNAEIVGDMNSDCVIDAFDLFEVDKAVNGI